MPNIKPESFTVQKLWSSLKLGVPQTDRVMDRTKLDIPEFKSKGIQKSHCMHLFLLWVPIVKQFLFETLDFDNIYCKETRRYIWIQKI